MQHTPSDQFMNFRSPVFQKPGGHATQRKRRDLAVDARCLSNIRCRKKQTCKGRQSTSTSHRYSVNYSRVPAILNYSVPGVLQPEMTEYSPVPGVHRGEMTEYSRVPEVLRAKMTEYSPVPGVLRHEMTEYSRVPGVLQSEMAEYFSLKRLSIRQSLQ